MENFFFVEIAFENGKEENLSSSMKMEKSKNKSKKCMESLIKFQTPNTKKQKKEKKKENNYITQTNKQKTNPNLRNV